MDIAPLDLSIIIAYLAGIVGLGVWAGLHNRAKGRGESKDYFLAGKTLKWPMIGLALFATNISTIHMVTLSQAGFERGLLQGNYELMAGFTLILLSLFFPMVKYLNPKKATQSALFGVGVALAGWLGSNLHLGLIEPWLRRRGRLQRLLGLPLGD